jgi:hypothetical protein
VYLAGRADSTVGLAADYNAPDTNAWWLVREPFFSQYRLQCQGIGLWLTVLDGPVVGLTADEQVASLWGIRDDLSFEAENTVLLVAGLETGYADWCLKGTPLGPDVTLVSEPDGTFYGTTWQAGPVGPGGGPGGLGGGPG